MNRKLREIIEETLDVSFFVEEVKKRRDRRFVCFYFAKDKLPLIIEGVEEKCKDGDKFIDIIIQLDYKNNRFAVCARNRINVEGWESELEA